MEIDIQRQKNHEDSGSLLYPHSILQQRDKIMMNIWCGYDLGQLFYLTNTIGIVIAILINP